MIREYKKRNYLVSNDKKKLDINIILHFLQSSYWAKDITKETVKKSIKHSYCFGLYDREKQIGFARVVTDFSRFAYLADVFVIEEYRGKGLSKFLLKCIMEDPELKDVMRWMLGTRDAHGLYEQFGFAKLKFPKRFMQKLS
jgi:GNAT superfamily N-acetyltransferase